MTKKNPVVERALRIELVRARAALERQRLARSASNLAESLTPAALVKSILPTSFSRNRPSDWLLQGVGIMRRYPLLASSASTLLSGVGKRHRWWKIGAGLLLSWQVARSMTSSKNKLR